MNNGKVTGFLRAKGTGFVNGDGEAILLRGAAVGNWQLLEGYMWGFMGKRADRTCAIEALVAQLCGPEYAKDFFPRYLDNFLTEGDIAKMAEEGLNSVRLPLHWRVLMNEGPGVSFREEGFALIDRCLTWCEKHGIYAILDLHGAPGGQTGANIDDTVDNIPRLFVDQDSWDKCIALWVELARRYKDRWIVGGYDLLNEPIRPPRTEELIQDVDFLIPALSRFYTECIAAIREVDQAHMISVEGAHWARDLRIFDHRYDDNMCLHFHAYWTLAHPDLLRPYQETSERLQVPLWLGETGENTYEWFTTLFPLLDEAGISWNFWPWKKAIRRNSPSTVRWPEGWQQVIDYLNGAPHPGFDKAQKLFDNWLENVRFENTDYVPEVLDACLRQGTVAIPGISYDMTGHVGHSMMERPFRNGDGMFHAYRFGTTPEIDTTRRHGDGNVRLDHPWVMYDLLLRAGERAAYTYNTRGKEAKVALRLNVLADCSLTVEAGEVSAVLPLKANRGVYTEVAALTLPAEAQQVAVSVACEHGEVQLESVMISQER